MNKGTFWKIIDTANASVADRQDLGAVLNATEKELMKLPAAEIASWHQLKHFYFVLADRPELWAACAAINASGEDYEFADFRSWLIAQGHEVYLRTLHDPDSLADLDIPAGSANFESFYYTGHELYAMKKELESKEPEAIFLACIKWTAENITEIYDFYNMYNMDQRAKIDTLAYEHLDDLTNEHDIYQDAHIRELSEEVLADILSEIHLGPKMEQLGLDDLPYIVPRLYQKYEAEQEFEQGDE